MHACTNEIHSIANLQDLIPILVAIIMLITQTTDFASFLPFCKQFEDESYIIIKDNGIEGNFELWRIAG